MLLVTFLGCEGSLDKNIGPSWWWCFVIQAASIWYKCSRPLYSINGIWHICCSFRNSIWSSWQVSMLMFLFYLLWTMSPEIKLFMLSLLKSYRIIPFNELILCMKPGNAKLSIRACNFYSDLMGYVCVHFTWMSLHYRHVDFFLVEMISWCHKILNPCLINTINFPSFSCTILSPVIFSLK